MSENNEKTVEAPQRKRLKRDLQREALARLEDAARTESDFRLVLDWWNRRDANRERRERDHETARSGLDYPLELYAVQDGVHFPLNPYGMHTKQLREGDFLDAIHHCPYEIHELVTDEDYSRILKGLSEDHKEILFLSGVCLQKTKTIGAIRGQTDRNIRKVRTTIFKKIHNTLFPILSKRIEHGIPTTLEEKRFVEDMKRAALADGEKEAVIVGTV